MTGAVFDIGYRRYEGEREGRWRSRMAVFRDGVRTALGLGRGPRAKVLPWFFLVVLSFIGLVMAMVAGAVMVMGGAAEAERMGLPAQFYAIASFVMYAFAALVAPELLCRDRREGVIQLYLVHPITASDYISSRWAAFLAVMLVAAWVPQAILTIGLVGGSPTPAGYLQRHWQDIPRFLLGGAVMAVYLTTLAMLVASFTTRRAYASVFMVGLFAITAPFTVGLSQEIDGPVGQWISMFNLTNIPLHVIDAIFGASTDLTEHAPARELGTPTLVTWWALWTIGPGFWLWNRYRRMTP